MSEISFEPQRDVSMNLKSPTTNYNAGARIELGKLYGGGVKSTLMRTLLNFDVSSLVGETIVTARLTREVLSAVSGGDAAQMRRCTRPDTWVEGEASWDNYKTGTPWTSGGGDYDDVVPAPVAWNEPVAQGSHTITGLKAFVDDALALRSGIVSLLLSLSDESSDGTDGWTNSLSREHPFPVGRPNLIVEYGDAVVPPAERRHTDQLPAHGEARPVRGASAVSVTGGARARTPRRPGLPASTGGDR